MTLQDILNLIQPQQGLRPNESNPLQSFGNRPSAPSGQFPPAGGGSGMVAPSGMGGSGGK